MTLADCTRPLRSHESIAHSFYKRNQLDNYSLHIGAGPSLLHELLATRILAPELFGLMVIVNSLRTGIDLISDIGIETNIVHNQNSSLPEFYNTAWTLQVLRGLLLWIATLQPVYLLRISSEFLSLALLIPVSATYFIFGGFVSVGRFLVQKDLKFARVNLFELMVDLLSAIAHISLALISPTVWASCSVAS